MSGVPRESRVQRSYCLVVCFALLFQLPQLLRAQSYENQHVLTETTLPQVIEYAIQHQPEIKQAEMDEVVVKNAIRGRIADWYPQINAGFNYQHTFDLQPSVVSGSLMRFGLHNTSYAQLSATFNLFNRDVLLTASSANRVRKQSYQNTSAQKIQVALNATKAFYDVLATEQQVKVSLEAINRLEKSYQDALSRYETGVSDKTDYKRAAILLANAKATLKTNQELLKAKEQYLKTIIGYPSHEPLHITYDSVSLEDEVLLDTTQYFDAQNHIAYKQLITQRELQDANVKYSYWSFLPNVSAYGYYNYNYMNNTFSELYNDRYPYSYAGLTVSLPIFQGGKRINKIREQKWTRSKIDEGIVNLENLLRSEYSRALAVYMSSLAQYNAQRENVESAEEVYQIIQLQYQNGIRAYLDVTIAETDLQTARINYYNALYQVLASKADVQHALGQIKY
jgi:outer membrane protein